MVTPGFRDMLLIDQSCPDVQFDWVNVFSTRLPCLENLQSLSYFSFGLLFVTCYSTTLTGIMTTTTEPFYVNCLASYATDMSKVQPCNPGGTDRSVYVPHQGFFTGIGVFVSIVLRELKVRGSRTVYIVCH